MQQGEAVLNVDWLAVSVRFTSPPFWEKLSVPNHKLLVKGSTNVWHDRVLMLTEYGDKVATILSRPKSQQLFEAGAGLIEIANEWLYHGCGWQQILHWINKAARFEILGLSRADLCADFVPNPKQQDIICGLSDGRYYVAGKSSGSEFWTQSTQDPRLAEWTYGRRIPHSQSWGHKTSNVKWKLYYKTRELVEVEDKPYIRDQWNDAGFDCRNVWRLEVSIKYPHQQLLADRPITYDIFNHEWFSILRSFYQHRFKVQANEGHKDRSNNTVIDFIPALTMGGTYLRVRPHCSETRRNGRISLMRKLVQACSDEAVMMNDDCREGTLELISQIVSSDHLEDYFTAMVGQDVWSWTEQVRVDAYTLCGDGT